MSNEKKGQKVENQEVSNVEEVKNEVATAENSNLDFSKLSKTQVKQSLNHEYLKLEKGEVFRGFYMGTVEQEIKGKAMNCAGFYAENGAFLSASHMIVQACSRLKEGDGVEIVYEGEKDLSNGNRLGSYTVNKLILD